MEEEPKETGTGIEKPDLTIPQTSWVYRRMYLYVITFYCMAMPLFCLIKDIDSSVANATTWSSFGIIGIGILSYVFGASVETSTVMKRFNEKSK